MHQHIKVKKPQQGEVMFNRKSALFSIGVVCLSAMLLLCMGGCSKSFFTTQKYLWPPCHDQDEDGYGDPASVSCTFPEYDCNDNNPDAYPNAPELCDNIDNQCPGDTGYGLIDEGCES